MGPRQILSDNTNGEPSTWYELTLRWLFNQGVSTVILVLILFGIWDLVPAAIVQYSHESRTAREEFRAINDKIHQDFREDLHKVTEALVKVTDAIRDEQNERRTHDAGS